MGKINSYPTNALPKLSDKLIGTSVGGTPENQTYNFTLQQLKDLFGGGGGSSITLTTTGSSGASTLVGTVLNVPNYTLNGLGGVPSSRQLTINGTAYDLTSDRSWTVGTVTSVSSLTLGTSGTDLSSSVSSGTTTPVITLNVPTASATNRGVLSPSDWSTFNSKGGGSVTSVAALTIGTSGSDITSTVANGTTTPVITLNVPTASGTTRGALSTSDWTAFNNKQAAGNYITSLTGEATASGPGAASIALGTAAVTGKALTGLNITGGTVLATDSILSGFGKLQNQINSLVGGTAYQGTWNAATNSPTLTSSVGTAGNYYIVNVAGTTNLNGITDWFVGDWAIFDGTSWQQIDNTDAVTSVNGQVGAVNLTTDNIAEGVNNLYYLNSRARAALSFAAGSGAYNSTTGVITIPTNTNQLTNGASFITLGSLSGTSPISYNNTTGAISISQSGTASNGYLSSTDWNTFNNKGTGTISSIGVSMPSAFSVSNSPLTSNGTIAITGAGTTLQYIDGTGALQTFPTLTGYVPYVGATQDLNLGSKNLYVNNVFDGFSSITASGTQVVLTVASVPSYLVTGSGGQTIKLPDATTLPNGAVYVFNNNQSSGAILVNNNSNTLVVSIPSGGLCVLELTDNSIAAGGWDRHFQAPSNVSWSTNTFDYPGSITSATWNGIAVAVNRGGTGASTAAGALINLGAVPNTRSISTTSPLQGGGDLSADRTLSILQSGSTQSGYLSSTDWSTFNSKVPSSRTITINGVTQDLSANRSWDIGAASIQFCDISGTSILDNTNKITYIGVVYNYNVNNGTSFETGILTLAWNSYTSVVTIVRSVQATIGTISATFTASISGANVVLSFNPSNPSEVWNAVLTKTTLLSCSPYAPLEQITTESGYILETENGNILITE